MIAAFFRTIGAAIAAIPRPPVATFGAAMVASFLNAATIAAIALLTWPTPSAESRIDALKWLGLSQTFLTAIVVISWAWGRPENFSITVAGNQASLDFDKDKDEP